MTHSLTCVEHITSRVNQELLELNGLVSLERRLSAAGVIQAQRKI